DLDLPAQAAGLHRPLRLVAKILLAEPGPVCEHAAEAQGAVRIRLPAAYARSVDCGLREDRDPRRGAAADHEGERPPAVWAVNLQGSRGSSSIDLTSRALGNQSPMEHWDPIAHSVNGPINPQLQIAHCKCRLRR